MCERAENGERGVLCSVEATALLRFDVTGSPCKALLETGES